MNLPTRGTPAEPAYEHNGRTVSREAFYAVACDPRRNVAVEACAGAGKTWMLVSRIVRALLDGAAPHEILAITFTKKAAGEMRQRLQEWLLAFSGDTPEALKQALRVRGMSDAEATRLQAPLAELARTVLGAGRPVQVRTFHGWFAALLRTAPLAVLDELGLPARYELLEDDSQAVRRVWRRFHAAVAADAGARADFFDAVTRHGRFQTQKALLAALSKRTEFALADRAGTLETSVRHFALHYPALEGLEEPWHALVQDGARARWYAWAAALGREANKTPQKAANAVIEAFEALAQAPGAACVAALRKAFFVAGEDRLNKNLQKYPDAVAAEAELQVLCAAQAQHEAWQHHQRLVRLSRLLLREFAALKHERGWVDMNDVERASLRLLSDPVLGAWVQERLDARVRHLLIDEFQDTNPLQWQALSAWLGSYAGAGGAAPSVFIVGDPKQSIYRFRRAEPQVFIDAKRFVQETLEGDVLSCDHTRRNAQRVIGVVNSSMGAAQDAGELDSFRTHTTESQEVGEAASLPRVPRDARSNRASTPDHEGSGDSGDCADGAPPWRDSLATPRELPEDTLRGIECRQAAQWLAVQLAAGTEAGEVMVLARKRDRLAVMQDELRALHIPAQQPEKTDLADVPEVQDVVALVDALVSTHQDISLARALRSPLFSLHDKHLAHLALLQRGARDAASGASPSWFALLQSQGLPGTLADIGPVLLRWKAWLDRLPPHDALDAIYHDGDVIARFAAAAPAALRAGVVANLRALLGAALEVDGARYATPYALVRAVRAGGLRAPATAARGAVRLLTIHGAKGLEADLVLMLDTDAPPAAAETMGVLVDWPGGLPVPRRFVFIASENQPPACAADLLATEQGARHREELNALYVAVTRARSRLVVSAVEPHRASPGSWWHRLEALCDPLAAAGAVPTAPSNTAAADFLLPVLPALPAGMRAAAAAPMSEMRAPTEPIHETTSPESSIGQAMHRLLEWTSGGDESVAAGEAAEIGAHHVRAAAREFLLSPPQAQRALALAEKVRAGDGAWAWDPSVVDWQGDEVPLFHAGALLRLDRLVRRRDTGEWWVLDYKSAAKPQRDEALRAQLSGYRAALVAAQPGTIVRAAFLTGQGEMVEIG